MGRWGVRQAVRVRGEREAQRLTIESDDVGVVEVGHGVRLPQYLGLNKQRVPFSMQHN